MLTIYAPEGIVRAEADRAGVIIQTDRRKWLQERRRSMPRPCRCLFNVIYPALLISNHKHVDRFISVPSSNCKMT
jgi:hypothetical protein